RQPLQTLGTQHRGKNLEASCQLIGIAEDIRLVALDFGRYSLPTSISFPKCKTLHIHDVRNFNDTILAYRKHRHT
ncbi:MAG TPA: hypothetical protein PKK12_00135, partial [Candidatus Aminicenantes bacterium]|nr:hypothetical protein [Candidatus Aminicenantes bacterium]